MYQSRTFPFKIEEIDPKINEELKTNFLGLTEGLVKVGQYQITPSLVPHLTKFYNVKIRKDDVWIVTFARAGTTLTQEIVWQLLNFDMEDGRGLNEKVFFLEYPVLCSEKVLESCREQFVSQGDDGEFYKKWKETLIVDELEKFQGRRVIRTHLPLSFLPPELFKKGCKVIYVARNPRDNAVSKYFHDKQLKYRHFVGDFKTYWGLFEKEIGPDQPYWQQILEGWNRKDHPNFMFLFYENITKDLDGSIRKISDFLQVSRTENELEKLKNYISFDQMKNRDFFEHSSIIKALAVDNYEHFRKGKNDNWKEYFDEEMMESSKNWLKKKYSTTDLRFPV